MLNPKQFYKYGVEDISPFFHTVVAKRGDKHVGIASWRVGSTELENIHVDPDHRRKGVATGMWNHALSIEPNLQIGGDRTEEGDAFAAAVAPNATMPLKRRVTHFFGGMANA
jgi:ribosomal protein S18 acetylase RimI-like enzyme